MGAAVHSLLLGAAALLAARAIEGEAAAIVAAPVAPNPFVGWAETAGIDEACLLPAQAIVNGRNPFNEYPGIGLHADRPYYKRLLRLLGTPLSPGRVSWMNLCARLRNELAAIDAVYVREQFDPRVRWYLSRYPMGTFDRIFDLLQFYFRGYDRRDEPDPDAWPAPNQLEIITGRVLDAYVRARGLQNAVADNGGAGSFRLRTLARTMTWSPACNNDNNDDDDDDDFHSVASFPDWFHAGGDDDDRDEFFSFADDDVAGDLDETAAATATVPSRAPGPVRDGETLPSNAEPPSPPSAPVVDAQLSKPDPDGRRRSACHVGDEPPATASQMVLGLSGFADAATLNFRWWTEIGAAAAIFGLVMLAIVTLMLADTHVFHLTLPDAIDAEPHDIHYVLKNGARISVRSVPPRSRYAPVAPAAL